MEAGDRAAGDGHEQGREHIAKGAARRSDGVNEAGEGGHVERRMRADDADEREEHHGVQQEGAEVVTRLQQDPHRRDGSHEDVDAADDHPGLVAQVDRVPLDAEPHDQGDGNNADERGHAQRRVSAVHEETEEDRQDDEQQRDDRRGRVGSRLRHIDSAALQIGGLERVGNDGRERGHDQDQGQVREDEEQALCLLADTALNNGADGLAVVADRCKQCAEVMHTAEEDTADEDPQQHRDPAENSGLNRTVDRAGTRDGGEVVSHQDRGFCGAVVHTVFQLVSRGGTGRVDTPLFGQPSTVEHIAQGENDNTNNQNYSSIH